MQPPVIGQKGSDCSPNTHTPHTHIPYTHHNNNKPPVSLSKGQEVVKRFLTVSDWPGSKVNRLEVDSVRSRTGGSLRGQRRTMQRGLRLTKPDGPRSVALPSCSTERQSACQ